eukprot:1640356-Rhodomonas_salina.2
MVVLTRECGGADMHGYVCADFRVLARTALPPRWAHPAPQAGQRRSISKVRAVTVRHDCDNEAFFSLV